MVCDVRGWSVGGGRYVNPQKPLLTHIFVQKPPTDAYFLLKTDFIKNHDFHIKYIKTYMKLDFFSENETSPERQ